MRARARLGAVVDGSLAGITAADFAGAAGFFAAAALPVIPGRAAVALRARAAGAAGAAAFASSLGFAAGVVRGLGFDGVAARDAAGAAFFVAFFVAFFAAFLRPAAAAFVLSAAVGLVRLPAGRER